MTSMVEARHLSKRVNTSEGELVILRDINLSISAAETVAIVGASGSGTVSYTHLTLPTKRIV